MKIHNIDQNTPEWHALRLGKFTASNAQAIANNGKGLETLCFEKVAEILTGKAKESYTNDDMQRGNDLEEMARNSYELETGIVVKRVGFIEKSDRIGCSPDGLIAEDGLQEIKCKNDANFVRYLFDKKINRGPLCVHGVYFIKIHGRMYFKLKYTSPAHILTYKLLPQITM